MQASRYLTRLALWSPHLAGVAVGVAVVFFGTFCVEVSANERASSRRDAISALAVEQRIDTSETARLVSLGDRDQTEDSGSEKMRAIKVDPAAFQFKRLKTVSGGTAPIATKVTTPSIEAKPQQVVSASFSTSAPAPAQTQIGSTIVPASPEIFSAEDFYAQWERGATVVRSTQVMPSSNYFGVDPNQCHDEWAGFCDCKQVSSGCKKCSKCRPHRR